MYLNSRFEGKATTCADKPNTSKTTFLLTNKDKTEQILIPEMGVASIAKATMTKDLLTLEVDAGAYRAVMEMADMKKGSRKDSDRLKRDVKNIVDRVNIQRRLALSQYEDDLVQWQSTPVEERGERPQRPKQTGEIKPSTFDPYLVTEGERRAYVKSYFLYEYLIQDMRLSGRFTCEDFNQSLRSSDKENIAVDDGGRKVRRMLGVMDGVLYTDTSAYVESAKKKTYKQKYAYKFHPISFVRDSEGKTQKLRYRIPASLKSLIKLQNQFRSSPDKKISIEEAQKIFKRFIVRDSHESLSALTTPTSCCNGFIDNRIEFEFDIYVPDYTCLELTGLPYSVLFECFKPDKLNVWVRYHSTPAKVTSCSRLWHPFHSLPREYRKYVTYNGSELIEAMDVRGCYYVLMSKALEIAGGIDVKELNRFKQLVRYGDIYREMGKHVLFVGCEENEEGVNYNQEAYLSFIGKDDRSLIKDDMQSFRNIKTFGQAENQFPMLARHFKKTYPTITQWLFSYPTHVNSDGETVKRLQHDMSKIETMIISRLCFVLRNWGFNPFTLHDAIYLSKEELCMLGKRCMAPKFRHVEDILGAYEKYLPEDLLDEPDDFKMVERMFVEIGKLVVNDYFWRVYDATTAGDVRVALGEMSCDLKTNAYES